MRAAAALAGLSLALAACTAAPTPTPSPASPGASDPTVTASPVVTVMPEATDEPSPTSTPEPSLTLAEPEGRDDRVVTVTVEPAVDPAAGGQITVTVTSTADTRIDDLVLRWPEELGEALFLAPFVPSDERIRDGGPPLVQPWTKWVIGPGERGEPAGTISLGWGPLLPGATLSIPIVVTRVAPGPVAFDLQVLSNNDLLRLEGGAPAQLRVEVP